MFELDADALAYGVTAIENKFLLEYMPAAKGDYVKVYLWGLFKAAHPSPDDSLAEMAQELVRLGWYVSFTGVVTFKNARVMKEVAAAVPLNRIVIETDCPYLAPTPYRGKRNASLYLPLVIAEIARIKEVSPAEVEQATYENVLQLFPKIAK